jgi:hypothetical protein
LKLTIDSAEALEDTLRVVGALYNVTLEVSPNGTSSNGSSRGTSRDASGSARPARGTRGSAPRRSAKGRVTKQATDRPARSSKARSKKAAGPRKRARSGADGQVSIATVRSWARENGYTVADRGRVPTEVVTAYRNAQPT